MTDCVKSAGTPTVWILGLLILGLIFVGLSRRKWLFRLGLSSILLATVLFYLLSIKPVTNFLVCSLERRYQPPSTEVLSTLDVVAILSGGVHPANVPDELPEPDGVTYSRVYSGVKIFRQSNASFLAMCGGRPHSGSSSMAEAMKALAMDLGVTETKLLVESESRDTMESAVNLAELLPPSKGRRIGLVTSASHMLRSERVFKKCFLKDIIIPLPVNYIYIPAGRGIGAVPGSDNFQRSSRALHEWVGLLWYSIRYR